MARSPSGMPSCPASILSPGAGPLAGPGGGVTMGSTSSNSLPLPGLPATFFLNARHVIVKRVFGAVTQAELDSGATLMTQRNR